MRFSKYLQFGILIVAIMFVAGCATDGANTTADKSVEKAAVKGGETKAASARPFTLMNLPEDFNHKKYKKGMKRFRRSTTNLYWVDPAADLTKYNSIVFSDFKSTYIENKKKFGPYIEEFNENLRTSLRLKKSKNAKLRLVGEVVECNPGSGALRYMIGWGAGKSAATVVCEVYEPGKDTPSLCMYSRSTDSGSFGSSQNKLINILEYVSHNTELMISGLIGPQ